MSCAKIGVVQYAVSPLQSEEAFWNGIRQYVDQAQAENVELLMFPEYLTAHLLSLNSSLTHREACAYLDQFTEKYLSFFQEISRESGIMILGGTHIHQESPGEFFNEAFFFCPDGSIKRQKKVHLIPEERKIWHLTPGKDFAVFETPLGKVAILICYDIEFPEVARYVTDQGAEIILCPTYTDAPAGYYRVRYCAQARAIENQRFVALCGLVGEMPGNPQVDVGRSRCGFFSPCDHPFPADGVLRVGEWDQPMLLTCELDLGQLRKNWEIGQVSPFKDRRPEVYQEWGA
ncbi:carbon-nitrogen hydrolase family protein [Thermoflavimicrobium dichotomicum]|uniref:Predicted amidohydrolase n=1 Tax=Thermoflavimicrobium dichotomicum TaxID=46223 RepID=A0A1I3RK03_9BACL|nr:carbon-nitrogen hydrolase family protein [Thermoflavimicrobium dichotomicum]SFJ46954.1 Predicted amidohydrolase [Thermoflavimicrobium dichotomicum]